MTALWGHATTSPDSSAADSIRRRRPLGDDPAVHVKRITAKVGARLGYTLRSARRKIQHLPNGWIT